MVGLVTIICPLLIVVIKRLDAGIFRNRFIDRRKGELPNIIEDGWGIVKVRVLLSKPSGITSDIPSGKIQIIAVALPIFGYGLISPIMEYWNPQKFMETIVPSGRNSSVPSSL